ncbi:PadR family transcriptional regulator [Aciduliprofundum sp. MAR08-339]|uniref:PadR family transcriptional regulator n=1 Tax=Aciduliprofundum sp. (strain MAR08-339) TaxID=673860 RepID=UPI0030802EF0
MIETQYKGRSAKMVKLTKKGRIIAEKLKEIDEMASMPEDELEAQRKRLHWIVDINTYTDHITAYDIHGGKKEIFNIWLKPNGKYLTLYCDLCHSDSCFHIDWALQDPVIGPEIREIAKKKGLKIKNDGE